MKERKINNKEEAGKQILLAKWRMTLQNGNLL